MDKKLQKGETCFCSSENILAIKYYDKKNIYIILTMHTEDFIDVPKRYIKQEIVRKPGCIHNYNNFMDAVDMKIYGCSRWMKYYSINLENN